MSTAFCEISESAPLVRLFAENSNGLVSLWDMLVFYAHDFVAISSLLGQAMLDLGSGRTPNTGTIRIVGENAGLLLKYCDELDLPLTSTHLRRLRNDIVRPGVATHTQISNAIGEIQRRLVDELQARKIFALRSDKTKYFVLDQPPFGESVADAFQSTTFDAIEASQCYAVGRNTACVFHLMRVLEIGLAALGRKFGIPTDHTNWETIINQIEKAIGGIEKDPNRPIDWKDDREFYSQCASHFRVVKDAWRNYTAHARGKYTDEEAETIFINMRGFMQKLATRLHE